MPLRYEHHLQWQQNRSKAVWVTLVQCNSKQAAGCSQFYVRGEEVLRVHTVVHVQVYCVSGISYLYRHIGDSDVITSCVKILNHWPCWSNRPTWLFLSTASVFAFRLSGPKNLPCGSCSWRGSLYCQTSRRTRQNFTTLSRDWITSMRRRWRIS